MKVVSSPQISTLITARAVIDLDTYNRVRYLVTEAPLECQWFCEVEATRTEYEVVYRLSGLYIPPQKVGKEDVESDFTEIHNMWKEYELQNTSALTYEAMKKAKVWCHSHVKMKAVPSKTDETQWLNWIKVCCPKPVSSAKIKVTIDTSIAEKHPPMMIIVNKDDEWFVRAFDPVFKIQFDVIPIEIENPVIYPDIDLAISNFGKYEPPKPPPKPNPVYSIGGPSLQLGASRPTQNFQVSPLNQLGPKQTKTIGTQHTEGVIVTPKDLPQHLMDVQYIDSYNNRSMFENKYKMLTLLRQNKYDEFLTHMDEVEDIMSDEDILSYFYLICESINLQNFSDLLNFLEVKEQPIDLKPLVDYFKTQIKDYDPVYIIDTLEDAADMAFDPKNALNIFEEILLRINE